ncbi:DUF3048 domain-containing protein [Candidatus Daviesbacteria bacterium]|nr:DUF3048 domain-containing protein [Candidatus Daviesbacteria bacterium]
MTNFLNIFASLTSIQKYLVVAILSVILFVASAGVSYSLFSKVGGGGAGLVTSLPGPSNSLSEDPNAPKTEACPLDGSMHTKEARANWEQRRPLAVMIENHIEARPQSGLSSADIIYEAVAEGGITRFMAVFYCNLAEVQVGPVRSARTYFLDWLSEYNALYAHVGGANSPGPADALGQIIKYGVLDLNQFSIGFPTFWRDYQRLGHAVATEHTMYSTTQKLWAVGAQRGWTNKDTTGKSWDANFTLWKFKDDQPDGSKPKVTVGFWQDSGDYSVEWNWDKSCDCYKQRNGAADHIDLNNKQQLSPKSVVVQFETESHANDGYENNVHLIYGTTGKGKALFFIDGKVTSGQWIKPNRLSRTKYVDDQGNEISFNRGQIWIQTVPVGAKVAY